MISEFRRKKSKVKKAIRKKTDRLFNRVPKLYHHLIAKGIDDSTAMSIADDFHDVLYGWYLDVLHSFGDENKSIISIKRMVQNAERKAAKISQKLDDIASDLEEI